MSQAIQAYQPGTIAEAWQLAGHLSGASLIGAAYRQNPANIMATVMHGASLGLNPAQALVAVHVIEGKPTLSADAMRAVCVSRSDVCEYFRCTETTNERATFAAKRKGDPELTLTFSMEDARKAGLAGRGNWNKYPAAMLRARAGSALARLVFPDLLLGVYDPDELTQDQHAERPPIVVQAVKPAPTPRTMMDRVDEIIRAMPIGDAANLRAWAEACKAEILALDPAGVKEVREAYAERLADLASEVTVEAAEHYSPAPVSASVVTASDLEALDAAREAAEERAAIQAESEVM